jgi:hypothetical protein
LILEMPREAWLIPEPRSTAHEPPSGAGVGRLNRYDGGAKHWLLSIDYIGHSCTIKFLLIAV